jgi:hypothetical protein
MLNDEKGRLAEVIDDGADLIMVPMSACDADATIRDGYAGGHDLATVLGEAGNTEQTGSTWARKVIANASVTVTIDDANDKVIVIIPDQTWLAVAASNDTVALLICVDGASDAARRVIGRWDFAVTTDGNDVTADADATNGIWQAA